MSYYINFRGAEGVETIDEFETMREAQAAVREYNANQSFDGYCYVSSRCTRAWREEKAMADLIEGAVSAI